MVRTALAAALLLAGTGPGATTPANPDYTCALRHRGAIYDSLKALPPDFQATVRGSVGAMADRGEFFNATDVILRPAPGRRFIRAGVSGSYRYLWYEQGGIAYGKEIVIFATDPSGTAHVAADIRATGQDLCVQTDALLGTPLERR